MPTFQSEWWSPSEAHTSLCTMLLLFRAHCLCSLGTGLQGGRESHYNPCLTTKPMDSWETAVVFHSPHSEAVQELWGRACVTQLSVHILRQERQINGDNTVSGSPHLWHFLNTSSVFISTRKRLSWGQFVPYCKLEWPRLQQKKWAPDVM